MESMHPTVVARPVATPDDVERMRLLRNVCASFMTGRQTPISPTEQEAWWGALDPVGFRCFLYSAEGQDVAFGLLRHRDGRWWVTGGVAEGWRGRGVGRQVFSHLCHVGPATIWLDVWDWNRPAATLYASLGFLEVGRAADIVTMRLDKGPQPGLSSSTSAPHGKT